ncbi:MAG: hypothetical protein ACE5E7_04195 [Anaerolineae bacterium]
MKPLFIWLGSGRTRKYAVSPKAKLLDAAARAGLPAPGGAVLLDEVYRLMLAEGIIVPKDGRLNAPDPDWVSEVIYYTIHFPRLEIPVAVRSLTAAAQPTPPQLDVDFTHPRQLADSLCRLWTAALSLPDAARRDVLIMEMVNATTEGTAVTRRSETEDFVVRIPSSVNRQPISLPKLRGWQRPGRAFVPGDQRLQMLLRGVRRTFGKGDWEITWADDGRICWLLQVRRLGAA